MVKALPLLPSSHIKKMFDIITEELRNSGITLKYVNKKKEEVKITVDDFLDKFLGYYVPTWFSRYKPEDYSVFGSMHRTNNLLERFNRSLHEALGTDPCLLLFLGN